MADVVKIRASVFIGGLQWLPSIKDPVSGYLHEYAGDIRGFTPHAVNTGRSRVEQEIVVDFVKRRLVSFANTGLTVLKMTSPDGEIEYIQGQAPTDGVVIQNESWGEDEVSFIMKASASNPLRPDAPSADYQLDIVIRLDGSSHIKGSHDGFPCYEFYKQVDFGEFQLIHSHSFHKSGDTPMSLAGEMEYHFEKRV
ncbi:DUF3238 domain-containing protein [Paenibacillus sp. GSMTC-2017]|uniref:DUF3238 domain-containing protein n=1 Tax=Paenibacillus sp. GSMTC-2017 TaxID=2794350 RepID=UPI0018D9A6F0|nr:DUF3238 domain-containing protein [Paenibacillus sp. GSMTC-2017]MBH5316279.1 DUF3238 domain-containing protein [Paenibacillus sp. GSMTC-2017]